MYFNKSERCKKKKPNNCILNFEINMDIYFLQFCIWISELRRLSLLLKSDSSFPNSIFKIKKDYEISKLQTKCPFSNVYFMYSITGLSLFILWLYFSVLSIRNTIYSTYKIKTYFVVCSNLWVFCGESDQVRLEKVPGDSFVGFTNWCFYLNTQKLRILDNFSVFNKTKPTWLRFPGSVTELML